MTPIIQDNFCQPNFKRYRCGRVSVFSGAFDNKKTSKFLVEVAMTNSYAFYTFFEQKFLHSQYLTKNAVNLLKPSPFNDIITQPWNTQTISNNERKCNLFLDFNLILIKIKS